MFVEVGYRSDAQRDTFVWYFGFERVVVVDGEAYVDVTSKFHLFLRKFSMNDGKSNYPLKMSIVAWDLKNISGNKQIKNICTSVSSLSK